MLLGRYGICKYKLVTYGSICTFDNFEYCKIWSKSIPVKIKEETTMIKIMQKYKLQLFKQAGYECSQTFITL